MKQNYFIFRFHFRRCIGLGINGDRAGYWISGPLYKNAHQGRTQGGQPELFSGAHSIRGAIGADVGDSFFFYKRKKNLLAWYDAYKVQFSLLVSSKSPLNPCCGT